MLVGEEGNLNSFGCGQTREVSGTVDKCTLPLTTHPRGPDTSQEQGAPWCA